MSSLITLAREAIADALSDVGVPVHVYPPQSLSAPCIALVPGFPYYEGSMLDGAADVTLQVQIMASNQQSLDDLIVTVVNTLVLSGMHPDPVTEPITDSDVGVISARIPVTMTWKE